MSNGPVDQIDYFAFKQHLLYPENEVCDNNTLFMPDDITPASQDFKTPTVCMHDCTHLRVCLEMQVCCVSIDVCAYNFITP